MERKRASFNVESTTACALNVTSQQFQIDELNTGSAIAIKKTFALRKADLLKNIPVISARCWAIFDVNKMAYVHGKREYLKKECASLTKIMTCYLVISLCKQWKINPKKTDIVVSPIASDIRGTSANLETGDILTVDQLLYGLMLPSGNDAAFALA